MTATRIPEQSTQEVDTGSEPKRRPLVPVLVAVVAFVIGGVVGWALRSDGSDTDVPDDVSALIDDWWAALERADGSVVDLYTENGYHLYGDQRFSGEGIAMHLEGGDDHNWVTDPLLIVGQNRRWVVTGGVSNQVNGQSYESAMTFEVVATADGVRFAHTAWSKISQV